MTRRKKYIFTFLLLVSFTHLNYLIAFSQKVIFEKQEIPTEIKSINCLRIENGNKLWIASGSGLFRIYNGKINKSKTSSGKKLRVNIIEIDNKGNKWLGTYSGELIKFKNNKIRTIVDFSEYLKPDNRIITSIAINLDSTNKNTKILLSTSDGQLFYYDTVSKEKGRLKSPVKNMVYSINYGYDNLTWLCSTDGFYSRKNNGRWKYKNDLFVAYGIFNNKNNYWALGRDHSKQAVLMLYYNYDGTTGQKYVWKEFQLKKLDDRFIRFYELGCTLDSYVWITSEKGLIRYNPLSGNVKTYNAKKNKDFKIKSVRHIAVQNDNIIWLSSSGKDLYKLTVKY